MTASQGRDGSAKRPDALTLQEVQAILRGTRAALFDFDGVVADTEPYQLEAYRTLLGERDIAFEADDFKAYMGRSEPEIYQLIERDLGIEIDVESSTKRRLSLFIDTLRANDVRPPPLIMEILEHLAPLPIDVYIVSANVSDTIGGLLRGWGIDALFEDVFTVGESLSVTSKPDLLARLPAALGLRPREMVLFEDSAAAISLGRAAGMLTVGVRHSLNGAADLGAHVEIEPFRP